MYSSRIDRRSLCTGGCVHARLFHSCGDSNRTYKSELLQEVPSAINTNLIGAICDLSVEKPIRVKPHLSTPRQLSPGNGRLVPTIVHIPRHRRGVGETRYPFMRNEDVVDWSTPKIWERLREHRSAAVPISTFVLRESIATLHCTVVLGRFGGAYLPISVAGGTQVEPC
jgi:hypothetical protein